MQYIIILTLFLAVFACFCVGAPTHVRPSHDIKVFWWNTLNATTSGIANTIEGALGRGGLGGTSRPGETSSTGATSSDGQTGSTGTTDSNGDPDTSGTTNSSATTSTSTTANSSSAASPSAASTPLAGTNTTAAASTTVTTNSTAASNSTSNGQLKLTLTNNLPSDSVHAYVSGLDPNGDLVMLDTNGAWYYPKPDNGTTPTTVPDNVAIPLGGQYSNTSITLPDYVSSARVWFADGELMFFVVTTDNGTGLVEPSALNLEDPSADINWGFVELTNTKEGGLFANLSFVDFVGMALGMFLKSSNDSQEAQGVPNMGKFDLCDKLKAQAKVDGQPWDQLCVYDSNDELVRVVSPAAHQTQNATAFQGYWNSYFDAVASQYAGTALTIDTQTDIGLVNCTVSGADSSAMLNCDGDNRPYMRPNETDIFGCNSGPFTVVESDNAVHRAVVPRLCAAFNRGTFLLDGGNVQPKLMPDSYYTDDGPKNWYSQGTHAVALDGRGYAFSYDDVSPNYLVDVAGIVSDPNPELLTIVVGGLPPSTTSD